MLHQVLRIIPAQALLRKMSRAVDSFPTLVRIRLSMAPLLDSITRGRPVLIYVTQVLDLRDQTG